jgi:hypothetical protein
LGCFTKKLPEQIFLDNVQHGLELTENESAVLVDNQLLGRLRLLHSDSAIEQQLPVNLKLALLIREIFIGRAYFKAGNLAAC